MPELFDLIEVFAESIRQGRFRQPRRDTDANVAGDQFEQRPAANSIELIEPVAEMALQCLAVILRQGFDDLAQARCLITKWIVGPDQRHGFGHVADIVARKPVEHRIDAACDQLADQVRLGCRK